MQPLTLSKRYFKIQSPFPIRRITTPHPRAAVALRRRFGRDGILHFERRAALPISARRASSGFANDHLNFERTLPTHNPAMKSRPLSNIQLVHAARSTNIAAKKMRPQTAILFTSHHLVQSGLPHPLTYPPSPLISLDQRPRPQQTPLPLPLSTDNRPPLLQVLLPQPTMQI